MHKDCIKFLFLIVGGANRAGISGSMPHMAGAPGGVNSSWNRGFSQNTSMHMVQQNTSLGYTMPTNTGNQMPGSAPAYSVVNRGVVKASHVPGMSGNSSAQMHMNQTQMQGSMGGLNPAHLSGSSNQSVSLHSLGMQSTQQHQQHMSHQQYPFSPPTMMVNNNSMSSGIASNFVGQGDLIDGLDSSMFTQQSSPNVDLNLDFIR